MGQRAFQKVASAYLFPHMQNNWFQLLSEVRGE